MTRTEFVRRWQAVHPDGEPKTATERSRWLAALTLDPSRHDGASRRRTVEAYVPADDPSEVWLEDEEAA